MAPYSSSAVIQVLTDPRLIWTDVIYSMFKSQIIIITVAAWAWSRVEGFKRRLFKSVWNISASGDFDFSDFLQLCTLVSLRSSRNVSFTSNPHLSFPSTQRWWDLRLIFGSASPVLLQADALFRIFFSPKAGLFVWVYQQHKISRGRYNVCARSSEQHPGFLRICSFVGSKREMMVMSMTVFLRPCCTSRSYTLIHNKTVCLQL